MYMCKILICSARTDTSRIQRSVTRLCTIRRLSQTAALTSVIHSWSIRFPSHLTIAIAKVALLINGLLVNSVWLSHWMVANVKENVHSCFQNHSIWPYLRADWDTRKLNLKNAFWSSLPLNIEWFHFRICFQSVFASIQCEQTLMSIHIKLFRKWKWKSSLMFAISLCETYIRFLKDPFASNIAFRIRIRSVWSCSYAVSEVPHAVHAVHLPLLPM